MKTAKRKPSIRHYFVDEAGDGTLFDEKGRALIGKQGTSRFFILGLVDLPQPESIAQELQQLRQDLLADPYFKNVPSMQPAQKKTALAFHAKDDLPEVRREVFRLLARYTIRFFAAVRTKQALLDYVLQRNRQDPAYRYNPNELYDFMVRCLFVERLHKDDEYKICFARRGNSDRTAALRTALAEAQDTFYRKWRITSAATIHIQASSPPESPGLQVTDYFLWALQRFYERREDRYVELLWESFSLVRDLDDTRKAKYGVYYTQKKPLKIAALPEPPEI
ncbi:MAG: DUF3800 domain-containing protein [Chloroflexi bacterium]|nr:DUF3800 domain-containing protein [Chloroflexota bacterium]